MAEVTADFNRMLKDKETGKEIFEQSPMQTYTDKKLYAARKSALETAGYNLTPFVKDGVEGVIAVTRIGKDTLSRVVIGLKKEK